jgi:hypothetical protein
LSVFVLEENNANPLLNLRESKSSGKTKRGIDCMTFSFARLYFVQGTTIPVST